MEKTQVTVEYDDKGFPSRLETVVLSTQHSPEIAQEQIYKDITEHVFNQVIEPVMIDKIQNSISTRQGDLL